MGGRQAGRRRRLSPRARPRDQKEEERRLIDLAALRRLAADGAASDRAFVDANLRLAWAKSDDRAALEALQRTLRESAARAHAELRADIAEGHVRGADLRARFEAVAPGERDHYVEEVLGVAYPPLEESTPGAELIAYTPSGWDEIVHAFDVTRLGAGDRFIDIGAGTGKVALLAAVLTGATAVGVELDAPLVDIAKSAAAGLGLALSTVRFDHGDARTAPLEHADVVFMYLPFVGTALATVMDRLARSRARFVCAGTLDRARHPDLVPVGAPRSWLQVYERRILGDGCSAEGLSSSS